MAVKAKREYEQVEAMNIMVSVEIPKGEKADILRKKFAKWLRAFMEDATLDNGERWNVSEDQPNTIVDEDWGVLDIEPIGRRSSGEKERRMAEDIALGHKMVDTAQQQEMETKMDTKLVTSKTRKEVKVGAKLLHKGLTYVVVGWEAPRHINSSGRIVVRRVRGKEEERFFPHVFGLKIVPTNMLPKVSSLGELRRLARTDDRYDRLLMLAAQNLGWAVPTTETPDLSDRAYRWLQTNADETGSEQGVVDEVNFCRDLV